MTEMHAEAHGRGLHRHVRRRLGHRAEVERAEREEHEEDAENEAPVADAVDDERLLARVRRALLLVPVADEEVRAETDALPADEHDQEVAPQNEGEHEEAEEVQVAEEARYAAPRLVLDVADRVDVDQEADAGDDEQHHRRQRIERERPVHAERADAVGGLQRNRRNPVRHRHLVEPSSSVPSSSQNATRLSHRAQPIMNEASTPANLLAEKANPDQPVEGGANARQERDQPD